MKLTDSKKGTKKYTPPNKMTLGQKKVSFVKWLMKKGVSLKEAKLICHNKFYHEI